MLRGGAIPGKRQYVLGEGGEVSRQAGSRTRGVSARCRANAISANNMGCESGICGTVG